MNIHEQIIASSSPTSNRLYKLKAKDKPCPGLDFIHAYLIKENNLMILLIF